MKLRVIQQVCATSLISRKMATRHVLDNNSAMVQEKITIDGVCITVNFTLEQYATWKAEENAGGGLLTMQLKETAKFIKERMAVTGEVDFHVDLPQLLSSICEKDVKEAVTASNNPQLMPSNTVPPPVRKSVMGNDPRRIKVIKLPDSTSTVRGTTYVLKAKNAAPKLETCNTISPRQSLLKPIAPRMPPATVQKGEDRIRSLLSQAGVPSTSTKSMSASVKSDDMLFKAPAPPPPPGSSTATLRSLLKMPPPIMIKEKCSPNAIDVNPLPGDKKERRSYQNNLEMLADAAMGENSLACEEDLDDFDIDKSNPWSSSSTLFSDIRRKSEIHELLLTGISPYKGTMSVQEIIETAMIHVEQSKMLEKHMTDVKEWRQNVRDPKLTKEGDLVMLLYRNTLDNYCEDFLKHHNVYTEFRIPQQRRLLVLFANSIATLLPREKIKFDWSTSRIVANTEPVPNSNEFKLHESLAWVRVYREMSDTDMKQEVYGRWIKFSQFMEAHGVNRSNKQCQAHESVIKKRFEKLDKLITGDSGFKHDNLSLLDREILQTFGGFRHAKPEVTGSSAYGVKTHAVTMRGGKGKLGLSRGAQRLNNSIDLTKGEMDESQSDETGVDVDSGSSEVPKKKAKKSNTQVVVDGFTPFFERSDTRGERLTTCLERMTEAYLKEKEAAAKKRTQDADTE